MSFYRETQCTVLALVTIGYLFSCKHIVKKKKKLSKLETKVLTVPDNMSCVYVTTLMLHA